jgi:hypothetical protein
MKFIGETTCYHFKISNLLNSSQVYAIWSTYLPIPILLVGTLRVIFPLHRLKVGIVAMVG